MGRGRRVDPAPHPLVREDDLLPGEELRRFAGLWTGEFDASRTFRLVARCFVDGEVLAVRVSGRLGVGSERGQSRLAGHDATNVKTQDLTLNTRLWKALTKRRKNGAETQD